MSNSPIVIRVVIFLSIFVACYVPGLVLAANDSLCNPPCVDPQICSAGSGSTFVCVNPPAGGFGVEVENPLSEAGINDTNSLVQKVLEFVSTLITSLAVLVMVYGGILYVFSAGNEARLGTAKKCLFWAVIGLCIGLGGRGILELLQEILTVPAT